MKNNYLMFNEVKTSLVLFFYRIVYKNFKVSFKYGLKFYRCIVIQSSKRPKYLGINFGV